MADVKWIKITVSMFDDEKIKLIEAMPEGVTILLIWIKLLCQAGKTNASGYIFIAENLPYTDEMLATLLNYPLSTIRLALIIFEKFRMIEIDQRGIRLVNWSKHQNLDKLEQIREQNKLRQAAARQRKMLPAGNGTSNASRVTTRDSNVTVTLRHATDRDIDLKKDNNNNSTTINNSRGACEGGGGVVVVSPKAGNNGRTESLLTTSLAEAEELVALYNQVTGLTDLSPRFLNSLMLEANVNGAYVREKLLLLDSPEIRAPLPWLVAAIKNDWRPAQQKQNKADKPSGGKANPGCPDCHGAGWRIVTDSDAGYPREYAEPCPCSGPSLPPGG